MRERIEAPRDWVALLLGFVLVFGLFHWSAASLGSDRGQHGILIAAVVVAAVVAADRLLLRQPLSGLLHRLGLGRPQFAAMVSTASVVSLLAIGAAIFIRARGFPVTLHPDAIALLPGLFAQAGVAEEVLFRAYLFGWLRVGRTFWRAAALSMLPFVAVHLVMFATMAPAVALAAVLLAVVVSFPLAYLFDLGGQTIWAPALLHFVIQAVPKLVLVPQDALAFALFWMAISAVVPLLVFFVRRPPVGL